MQSTLTPEEFLAVVDKTPLVSIDLVVRDHRRRVLLGLRVNDPARGFWFVPGGRIMKGETLDEAFSRISAQELGVRTSRARARLLGVFTHQYETNFAGTPDIGTHYVVLAYELELFLELGLISRMQHSDYKWWTHTEVAKSEVVHPHNLPYFLLEEREPLPSGSAAWIAQYEAVNNRRNSFNQLLWQAPALSLTAQAFLFSIVFSKDVSWDDQLLAAVLALAAALASVQLLAKHRSSEKEMAIRAAQMEERAGIPGLNERRDTLQIRDEPWYLRQSSYSLWLLLLLLFGATSLGVVVKSIFANLLSGAS